MNSISRMRKLGVLMCLLILGTSTYALDGVDVEITADYYGKYVWRGQNLDDDPAFQPGISATYEGFTFGIWGSMETTSYGGNSGEFTEVDEYIDYSGDVPGIEGLGFSVGLIYYDFPGTSFERTAEAYWGFSLDVPLSPSITVFHDIDEVDGMYASFSIGHSIENIIEFDEESGVSLELGASYGWADESYNQAYWGITDSSANDLALSASLPFELGGWSICPSVNYVTLLGDVKDSIASGVDDNFFYVGIGISKGF